MTTKTLTGFDAIDHADENGLTLSKHADPVEGAREGVSVEDAREVAAEDPSLIFLTVDEASLDAAHEIGEGQFGGDGQCFEGADGVSIAEACTAAGGTRVHDGAERERFEFADGSAITICGGAWDYGWHGCYCWRGADHGRHQDGCEAA